MDQARVILTDPPPLPRHEDRCPRCDAKKDRRMDVGGFGRVSVTACGACGYEFERGTR